MKYHHLLTQLLKLARRNAPFDFIWDAPSYQLMLTIITKYCQFFYLSFSTYKFFYNYKIFSGCLHFRLSNLFPNIIFCPQNFLYHIFGLPTLETSSFITYCHNLPTNRFPAKLKLRWTFRKIGQSFGNFWERILKKYKKIFEEIQLKFHVTSKKI